MTSKLLRPENASKVAGASLLAISALLFLLTDQLAAGMGAAFIGVLVIVLMHERTVEEEVAVAAMESGVQTIDHLLNDLEVRGKGVIVPPSRNLTESRVYVPAGELRRLPDLYDEMGVVSTGGEAGISLKPPGAPLLDEAKRRMEGDLEGSGLEGARECMNHLSVGMELASGYELDREEGIWLNITLGKYAESCGRLREGGICEKTGCPVCSAFLTALAEALSRPIRIVEVEWKNGTVKYSLEELEGS
ncbi:MAG: hypothetical protein ACLFUV_09600 [Methanomassiliicoccales archaeon]